MFAGILLLLVCLLAVAIMGASGLWTGERTGPTSSAIFAICILPFLGNVAVKAFRPSVDILVDTEGVEDGLYYFGKIPWKDIADVSLVGKKRRHLILNLRNYERYSNRHSWRKWLLFNDTRGESRQIILSLTGFKGSPRLLRDVIYQELMSRRQLVDV